MTDRVNAHRKRMRAKGMRPIQVWVHDVRNPTFAKEAARQSQLIAGSGADDLDFIESIAAPWGDSE